MLQNVRAVCSPKTKVYVRCHPWTSRHGGHLYLTINRAYAHILLSDETLAKIECEPVRKITRPLSTYDKIFNDSGFNINSVDKIIRPMEKLLVSADVAAAFEQRLSGETTANQQWQKHVLPIEFIDYVLTSE